MKIGTSNTTQALWIGIGSLFSFFFSIISTAILSRYLTKDSYGTYRQVMYVYSTLLTVFTLGLPLAYSYFLPKIDLEQGKHLVWKLNKVFFIMGFVFTMCLYFGAGYIADILKNPELAYNIRIFSPVPILLLPTMGLQGVLATYKRNMLNTWYIIISRLLMILCIVLPVVLYECTVDTAIWGFVISSFFSLIIALCIMNMPFKSVKSIPCDISFKQIFAYSIPLMSAGLLGVGIKSADQFYVSRYYGQEVFAEFANGSIDLPFVGMVLSAGSTILLPVFSKMMSDNTPISELLDLWKRTAIKGSYILYPIIVFCFFYSEYIMTILYGDKYFNSSYYFCVRLFVNFFTVIQFYPIILAMGKTKRYSFIHFIVFVVVWIFEYIAAKFSNNALTIAGVSSFCQLLLIYEMMRLVAKEINVNIRDLFPFKELSLNFLCCMLSILPSFIITQCTPLSNYKIASICVGFIVYFTLLILFGRLLKLDYFCMIRPLISKFKF